METADLNETFEEAKEKSMVSKGSEKYPENLYLYELFNSSTINGMLTNDISYHGSGNQWAMECLINESSMSPMKLYQQYKDTRRSCKNLASVMPVIDRTMKRTLGRLMSEQGVGATDRNVEDAAGGDEFSEFEDLLDDDEDDHDDSVVRVIEFK